MKIFSPFKAFAIGVALIAVFAYHAETWATGSPQPPITDGDTITVTADPQAHVTSINNPSGHGEAHATASPTGGKGVGTVQDLSKYTSISGYLPGQTAAPAVGGNPCLEHRPAWGPSWIMGKSGHTEFNPECQAASDRAAEYSRCMGIANMYKTMGKIDEAMLQLAACGGVSHSEVAHNGNGHPTTGGGNKDLVEGVDYVTPEALERMYQKTMETK